MERIEGSIIIERPITEVFDFVADERNEPRYNPNMLRAELISAGPIGPGSAFRATSKGRGGVAEMTIALTGFERPRRLTSSTHLSSMEIEGTISFDPVPEGTRMSWSWQVEPRGLYKLIAPLIGRAGRRQEETIWRGLKRYLESAGGGQLPAPPAQAPCGRPPEVRSS